MSLRACSATLVILVAMFEAACGGGSSAATPSGTNSDPSTIPEMLHVVLVVEENHSYDDVIGNTAMPYFNSLVSMGGLATQYYADTHPSLPNYFMLTTGATIAIDDSYAGTVTQDNVVRAIIAARKTWKCYAESLPSPAYLGEDQGDYIRRHVPFTFFSDVQDDPMQAANIVPFTQFATDLASGTLPSYSFIVPNRYDDAHDCPGSAAACDDSAKLGALDQWLQTNLAPLINSATFQTTLLIITFDESEFTDPLHGGGHVATVLLGSHVTAGYKSITFYQHESTLRLMMESIGISDLPGNAANAPSMSEFFQ